MKLESYFTKTHGITKYFILLLFIAGITNLGVAQNFSEKTNKIHLNYAEEVRGSALPTITWITPRVESSFSKDNSIKLKAEIKSSSPLAEVKARVRNGDEIVEKDLPFTPGMTSYRLDQKWFLFEGGNEIELIAVNEKGGTVSSIRNILHGKADIAEAVDANRKDYALIIATDNYDNWDDLGNPINDAKRIEGILKEKYGFVTDLIENPALEDINDKLYDYNSRKFNPQDQLLIFVAGHGYYDETLDEGYLVASNSLKNDRGKTSYLAHQILRSRIENIKCEHIMLVMDVCFGGTIDPKMQKTRAADLAYEDSQFLVKKLTKRTRKFLTSGSKEYVPDGEPGKHSPFAEKFIMALNEIGGAPGRVMSTAQMVPYFLRLSTEPRFGSFGTDDPASDFIFVARQ